jgi:hypothetical protein
LGRGGNGVLTAQGARIQRQQAGAAHKSGDVTDSPASRFAHGIQASRATCSRAIAHFSGSPAR